MKAWSVIKTILSGFIWGIGQVFNRQYLKALFFFVFFAIFVTLELATSNYFYEETKENEIALSKISGKSLGRWYEKALFQQYDVNYILNGNSIDTFEDFLEEIGVEKKANGTYYAGPTGRENPSAKNFTEERFIEFMAQDLKEASYLRYTQFGTNNEIRAEDFDTASAQRLITLENSNMYWDEINHKFYLPVSTQSQAGVRVTDYYETHVFYRLENPEIITDVSNLTIIRKTGNLYFESGNYYVGLEVNTDPNTKVLKYLLLSPDTFEIKEAGAGFSPLPITQITGPVYALNGMLYEYYQPGLIHNGVRAQYKQTPFAELFRKAMVQGQTINPVSGQDYVKLMVRVYMELNPEFKAQFMKDFNNFFYDRAGMFVKGYWEVLTLGQAQQVNLNGHLALVDAMVGRVNEPESSNMRNFIQFEGQVNVRGHVSTLLLLDGLIMVILSMFFFIFAIWGMIDTYKVSERLRLNKEIEGNRAYFKNVWDNGFEYIILSPAMFVLAFISIMPIVFGFVLAFTSIGGNGSMDNLFDWVGFKNFITVFDPNSTIGQGFGNAFWRVLTWTLIWAVLSTVTVFFGGFFQALIINAESVVFKKLWRTILILPWAIPALLSQMVFSVMFNETGFINQLLMQMGIYDIFTDWGILGQAYNQVSGLAKTFWLGHENIQWFTNENNPNFVRATIIVLNIWLGFPYFMALMTGIMTAIDKSLYEAADIDGATGFQKLRQITMPLVLYSTAPILIMTFSGNFNNFGVIYFITGGGPGNLNDVNNGFAGQTDILISWMYRLTTEHQIYNLASVFSVLIFIFVGSLTAWNLSRTRAFQED